VVYRPQTGSEPPRAVGTVGLVWGIDRDDVGPDLLQVRGEMLVAIDSMTDDHRATVATVEDDDPADPGLVAEVERLLRRYLGATAEAGEGGNVGASLSGDQVIASHQVASLLRISAPELQELLEAGSARRRLHRAADVLRRETGLLRSTMGGRGA
jgi:Lon protease-like protein